MSKLAIHGGKPVRSGPFPEHRTIGAEEKAAVAEVLDGGVLSGFIGTCSPEFYGGPRVQRLERDWEAYFGTRHAVSVNSATSGLNAAVGAAGVGPGDEVICSPYTMTASAACALVYSAIPIFADIDPVTFCITPDTIRAKLSPRTKAIVVVDLFGHPADLAGIMALAAERGLTVIEDAAQAPGARCMGRYAGTLAHLGVFSLNRHKTIHCGEGGVVVTEDDELAERVRLIRNHAEVVVKDKGTVNLVNLLGFNYRMTEIEAAIAGEQLKKLRPLLAKRQEAAAYLTRRLRGLPGLTPPAEVGDVEHGWYFYCPRYEAAALDGVSRARLVAALRAEGVTLVGEGYVEPIYLQPLYQQRILFGEGGHPFSTSEAGRRADYAPGLCPVAERMHFHELIVLNAVQGNLTMQDLDDVAAAFHKVFENAAELRQPSEVLRRSA